ncbi:hypothetical protein [Brevibacillus sp. H7]|uniref:hypothetical protein n=1 Tax=Brevibacillus sp. H7 TaxID=3349138 RepID=UPI0037FA9B13
MEQVTFATGQPITPKELQDILGSSEVIDLTSVKDLESLAQPLKPCNVSAESDLDEHNERR